MKATEVALATVPPKRGNQFADGIEIYQKDLEIVKQIDTFNFVSG